MTPVVIISQDLYERIEKADEKLNKLTQNLGKSNSNADELDTTKVLRFSPLCFHGTVNLR